MKNLDLKQMGVQELSTVESRDVDGGLMLGAWKAVGAALTWIWDNADDISEGWEAGQAATAP